MNLDRLIIEGNTKLSGEIKAAGAKNATTKLLVASLLSDKKCVFYNVPNITEIDITISFLKEIGMEISWDKKNKIIIAETKEIKSTKISQKFSGANRIPILILGALLGRCKENIFVPIVGGDNLGKRPLDFHISALQKLNAQISFENNYYVANSKKGLIGTIISLPFPSVGATENTILASVYAKGTTVIKNAATEPEIIDLILFLQKLGVNITIDVNRTIYIKETKKFYETEHYILPDRNEIVSYALLALATKGDIFIKGAEHSQIITFLNKLRELNASFKVYKDGIHFFYKGPLKGNLTLETDVHPGFMTDWQQPFTVLLTQVKGFSIIHETVYENRFGYTKILKEMGADIGLFTNCLGSKKCRFSDYHYHSIIIKGPTKLKAHDITIPDLRAGFSYIMAAILAEGKTTISNIHFIDRGYEDICLKLRSLGAEIERQGLANNIKPFLTNLIQKERV